ncbi:hypothetical protein CC80DRAFT_489348 [Byssothecium circinans]|uniref:Uncharacterized protein n=1 Tax=Byssothecium circinans TaxID=147558 RepID=A0A6A5U4Q7_9PLEO|nr:hypothetical protein CC80DRAFT_489348 [Byssothecium circinans]
MLYNSQSSDTTQSTAVIPACCYINKQVYLEAVPFFSRTGRSTNASQDVQTFRRFLEANESIRSSIRSITFSGFAFKRGAGKIYDATRLIRNCPMLENVTIESSCVHPIKEEKMESVKLINKVLQRWTHSGALLDVDEAIRITNLGWLCRG